MVRVLVTGDRNWNAHRIARLVVGRLVQRHGADGFVVVHGAATGVDSAFEGACRTLGVKTEPHPADWTHKRTGPLRNAAMVAKGADYCLAVHRSLDRSKGTRGCVRLCLEAGIKVWAIESDEVFPDGKPAMRRVLSVD